MTPETRELIARALRRAAAAWEADASEPNNNWSDEAKERTRKDAIFCRGFAEALEVGARIRWGK